MRDWTAGLGAEFLHICKATLGERRLLRDIAGEF